MTSFDDQEGLTKMLMCEQRSERKKEVSHADTLG